MAAYVPVLVQTLERKVDGLNTFKTSYKESSLFSSTCAFYNTLRLLCLHLYDKQVCVRLLHLLITSNDIKLCVHFYLLFYTPVPMELMSYCHRRFHSSYVHVVSETTNQDLTEAMSSYVDPKIPTATEKYLTGHNGENSKNYYKTQCNK